MTGRITLTHRAGALPIALDTQVGAGITALFGPSGAGKTTILRAVAGLVTPDEGQIELSGQTWFDSARDVNLPAAARAVGYVFQEPRLFPHMSVRANLRYGAGRPGPRPDFQGLVELLGLSELLDRRPHSLSGGEAQRVALGRALYSAPRILLMDEPLSALDQALKRDILPYFERLRSETGIPILYVSHDIDEIARLADEVVLIDGGQAQAAAPVADVLAGGTGSALGRAVAGGLLRATVSGHDETDNLTEARIGAQSIWLPGRIGLPGETLRLRLDARDVTLSVDAPSGLSALNILPVTITAIDQGPGAGALVRLDHQGQALTARLTRRSITGLGLEPGQRVHAILKTMAATPERVAAG